MVFSSGERLTVSLRWTSWRRAPKHDYVSSDDGSLPAATSDVALRRRVGLARIVHLVMAYRKIIHICMSNPIAVMAPTLLQSIRSQCPPCTYIRTSPNEDLQLLRIV